MKLKAGFAFAGLASILLLAVFWVQHGIEPRTSILDSVEATGPEEVGDEFELSQAADADSTAREGVEGERRVREAEAATAEAVPNHRITGRIVDDRRRPVSGAHATCDWPGAEAAHGISDAKGRFELLMTIPSYGRGERPRLIARDGTARMAVRTLFFSAGAAGELQEIDAGTLVLFPAHPLSVQVRMGKMSAPRAVVKVQAGHQRLSVGEYETDDRGNLELKALPAGVLYLSASVDQHAGRTIVHVPDSQLVMIELEPRGAVDILVVNEKTGTGIPGAHLSIMESYPIPAALPTDPQRHMAGEYHTSAAWSGDVPTTDVEGRARIEGLEFGVRYQLQVRADGYGSAEGDRGWTARIAAGADLVELQLTPEGKRSVRWPVIAGEIPAPAEGTSILLRHQVGAYLDHETPEVPSAGVIEAGYLIVDGIAGRVNLAGVAPDGSLARLWCKAGEDLGPEISFREPRTIEVRVRDESGTAVESAHVQAFTQGNNELCETVMTDAQGLAVMSGLYGHLAEVYVAGPAQYASRGKPAGTVDLEKGDALLEFTLNSANPIRLRLTLRIDGSAQLPPRFQVRGPTAVEVIEELPEAGELLLELARPEAEGSIGVTLIAPGFVVATTTFDGATESPIGDDEQEKELHATFELVRTAVLIAEVAAPAEGRVSILPQRFDEQLGAWNAARELQIYNGRSYSNGPGGSFVFSGVTPGRWRVIDERTKQTSSLVDIQQGDRAGRVELDLSIIEWVTGRIESAEPDGVSLARVLLEHDGREPIVEWRPGLKPPSGAYARNGEFRICVPNDRQVRLLAWHPWLVPDATAGSVTLRGGRDGVVLKLVPGNSLILPQTQLKSRTRSVRIARYAAGAQPDGEALEWHYAAVQDGAIRCALPGGRWTLLIEPGENYLPLALLDVEIAGATQLAPAQFTTGSKVRMKLLLPDDSDAPRISLFAERLDAPIYHRSINSSGEGEVLLSGLGPGRYLLRTSLNMTGRRFSDQEIEVDGVNDLELELDLR